jgi:exosortase/archaeosortase
VSAAALLAGLLLPESVMHTRWFQVLTTFVAINTVLYLTLAVIKTLPKAYLSDWVQHRNRRAETRSIYPDSDPITGRRPTDAPGSSPSPT